MGRILRFAALTCGLALATPSFAQEAPPPSFETVDAVRVQVTTSSSTTATLWVTGLMTGQDAPVTKVYRNYNVESCLRMLTLSMERPGRYSVTVLENAAARLLDCTLARK